MLTFCLTIGYFIIFGAIILRSNWFSDERIPKHWLLSLFGVKVIVSILLTAIYTNYYTDRSTADIYKYFDDSLIMFEAIKSNPLDYIQMVLGLEFGNPRFETMYYIKMLHWTRPFSNDLVSDSHVIIRFNAFVRLFSFGEVMVHNVFINFLSFTGLFILFKHFKHYALGKERLLFMAIALVPSVLFWGSGLLKEGLLILALAFIVSGYFKLLQKATLFSFITFLVGLVLLVYTKFYLLVVLIIPLLGALLNKLIKKQAYVGYAISFVLFMATVNLLPFVHTELDIVNQISMKQQSFSNFIQDVPANSGFELNQLSDGKSIVANIPNALLNTVVRPYPWECKSALIWLNLFENILVLVAIIFVLLNRGPLAKSSKNVIWFNLIFVCSLYILIGLTTPVFGAIVRYKIPGLLFMFITLVITLDKTAIKKRLKWLK